MKLFMDSSTKYLYLNIIDDKMTEYTYVRLGKNDHSEMLMSSLEAFLKELNLTAEDITEVYVGKGPGSYTGVRISGTCGKTLSFIKNLPFYSFSSLDYLLANCLEKDGTYLAHIDAKKNYSYFKVIKVEKGKIEVIQPETFGSNEMLDKYQDALWIEASEDAQKALNILKYNLVTAESNLEYIPNYLRSEFN